MTDQQHSAAARAPQQTATESAGIDEDDLRHLAEQMAQRVRPLDAVREAIGALAASEEKTAALAAVDLAESQLQMTWTDLSRSETTSSSVEPERTFREIADEAPAMLWISNNDFEPTYLSRRWSELTGVDREDAYGSGWERVIHPDDLSRLHAEIAPHHAVHEPYSLVCRVRQRDGDYRWWLTQAIPRFHSDGSPNGYIGSVIDIHDLKVKEQDLAQQAKVLSEAQALGHVGSFEWTIATNELLWSEELYRIFGESPETFTPSLEGYLERISSADRERVQRELEIALEERRRFETAKRIIRPDGTTRFLFSRVSVESDDRGEPVAVKGACLDITERKLAEDTISQLLELTAPWVGDEFFQQLVNQLCKSCEASWAIVAEVDPDEPEMARTIAVSRSGEAAGNFRYRLAGSPCEVVLTQTVDMCCVYPSGVRNAFPEDEVLIKQGIEGYVGIPLRSSDGQMMGLLALMQTEAFINADQVAAIAKVVAGRAGAELARRRAVAQLVAGEQQLRETVMALKTSLRELEVLADTLPMAVFRARFDGSGEFVNPRRYRKLSGRAMESWNEDGWLRAVHHEDRERVSARWREAVANQAPWREEFRYLQFDGSTTWVLGEAKPYANELDDLDGYIGALVDVTSLKDAERHLQRTQFMVDNAAIGVFWLHRDSRIAYVNDLAARMLGYTRVELTEMSILEITRASFETWESRFLEVKEAGTLQFEANLYRRDHSEFPAEITTSFTEFEGQEYLVADVQDITRRKDVEERLELQSAELVHVARLSSMGQMMAALSHELAQPLNALANFSQVGTSLIERGQLEGPVLPDLLKKMSRQSERAGEILRRIRSYVRQTEPHRSSHDLNEIVLDSVSLMQHEFRRHRIAIDTQVVVGKIPVQVDRVRIQQVIVNLLTNARDAVSGVEDRRKRVYVRTAVDGNRATVQVEDEGCGISPEIGERLFEAFVTSKDDGMGIGLSICRTIVGEHGGTLTFADGQAYGTRFSLTLPMDEAPDGPEAAPPGTQEQTARWFTAGTGDL